ncbi:MAG: hypothetical protein JWO21_1166, partial [Solirubrobacterales bacterium]|nr:hypothetical protein [Solirubrobacterales bacterium]
MTSISRLRRIAIHPGFRARAVGVLAALSLAVGLGAAQTASANVSLGGVTMSSSVICHIDDGPLEISPHSTNSTADAYAMVYLQLPTGVWIHENGWHSISGLLSWSNFTANFSFGARAYYHV